MHAYYFLPMNQSYQSLSLTHADGVMTVTLLGPGKGNAMGPEFWDELPAVMDSIDQLPDVRCVVVRGSGQHFSYGLDVGRMLPRIADIAGQNAQAFERRKLMNQIRFMQSGFVKMHTSPKPVIAAVHGWCIGGGLNMISAADIRLCSQDAKFSLREAKLAITPDIGALTFLPPIIGQGYTRELAFTARDFDAAFAHKIGLVNHVFDTPDALFAAADDMARQIAALPAPAVQGAKDVLNYGEGKDPEAGLQYVAVWNSSQMYSADFTEAMQAMQERRKPVFNGE
jgi:enoyl-CoA hydratase